MLDAKAGSRLPATIVQVCTEHEAPQIHHTDQCGIRVVKGPHRIVWSDGHTE